MGTEVYDNIEKTVITQWKGSTVEDFLKAICVGLQDSRDILTYLENNIKFEDAEGVWLDLWGKLFGVPRLYVSYEPYNIFTFLAEDEYDPGDTNQGFLSSSGLNGGVWEQSTGGGDGTGDQIDDAEYRRLIKAKMSSIGKGSSIPDIWQFILDTYGVDSFITILSRRYCSYDIAPDNYITNGSFKTDLSNWDIDITGTGYINHTTFDGGEMQLGRISSGGAKADQNITIDPGKYIVYLKSYNTSTTGSFLNISTTQGGLDLLNYSIPASGSPRAYIQYIDVPDGTDNIWVRLVRTLNGTTTLSRLAIYPYFANAEINYLKNTAPVAAGDKLEILYSPDLTDNPDY